jgi:teichuronic acid biosynthesis glycosyltransferase TuaG
MNNLVSIIIPYYKKKHFIKKTLQSIKNQTYKKFEIIIVYDDTDLSDLSYLKKITKNNRKVRILLNKKNYGAGISRNVGINIAKGKFIAFLDADDFWVKNKLLKQINYMSQENIKISHTSYFITNETGSVIGRREAKNLNFSQLIKSCNIGLSTVIINKSIIKKYNFKFPDLNTKEDYVLWLRISKKKIPIAGINQKLTYWRKSKNSLSANSIRKLIDGYYVYRKHMKYNFLKSLYSLLVLSINFLKKN